MADNQFLVMDWEWLEDSLDDKELEDLYGLLEKASTDKPDYKYIVVNTEEPYSGKIQEIVETGRAKRGMVKSEALRVLEELKGADPELAHAEADEIILRYLNDKDIEKAFDEVPKWYA